MISLLFAIAALAMPDSPEMVTFLRSTAAALAEAHDEHDARTFLDHFDRAMPGFATLRQQVEELVARAGVGSAIEIATESGDENRRTLELDWVLEIQDQRPRRKVVKCTIERRGKDWKFTTLEPLDFFKY
jgi:hypothetical protein